MRRQPIPVNEFLVKPCHLWSEQWLLLTAGDYATKRYNTMTVAWGGMGAMWSKPFAQVVVRPVRYTFEFMEAHDTFTLSAFDDRHRPALQLLGSKSGRDGDKIAASKLTATASSAVAAPCFAEASLVIECRKLYWHDFDPAHFLAPDIADNYPKRDYHRCYFGEMVAITGAAEFRG